MLKPYRGKHRLQSQVVMTLLVKPACKVIVLHLHQWLVEGLQPLASYIHPKVASSKFGLDSVYCLLENY